MLDNDRSKKERALLVGLFIKGDLDSEEREQAIKELAGLAETVGVEIICSIQSLIDRPNAGTFLGKGKMEEITSLCENMDIEVIIFQRDLTPVQQRNLERAFDRKVINRTELILDIFAQHAKSRAGKIQVELAQLRYRLSHLTGRGVLMSRLGGGIGTRGPGETKLETERRSIENRISKLEGQLKKLASHRREQRKSRIRTGLPLVSLVGYTNAGKSSLLNHLTSAHVPTENQLFTTLDTTTRKFPLPDGRHALLSDTVGFIKDMPEDLMKAFRATLEEIQTSNLVLYVVDVTEKDREEKIETVRETLQELEVMDKPILTVFNKIDLLDPEDNIQPLLNRYKPACVVSVKTGEGLDELMGQVSALLTIGHKHLRLIVPIDRGDIRSRIHKEGKIISEAFRDSQMILDCEVPEYLLALVEDYVTE